MFAIRLVCAQSGYNIYLQVHIFLGTVVDRCKRHGSHGRAHDCVRGVSLQISPPNDSGSDAGSDVDESVAAAAALDEQNERSPSAIDDGQYSEDDDDWLKDMLAAEDEAARLEDEERLAFLASKEAEGVD